MASNFKRDESVCSSSLINAALHCSLVSSGNGKKLFWSNLIRVKLQCQRLAGWHTFHLTIAK